MYKRWYLMRRRCNNPSDPAFERYGGRGIRVCERWNESLDAFIADMGYPPPRHLIERIDNDGPYSKENCTWATSAQQQRNRRNNINVTINGITRCLKDWCAITGVSYDAARERIHKLGWSLHDAATTPVDPTKQGGKGISKRGRSKYRNRKHRRS